MAGFIVKLFICPIAVLIAAYILPNVYYPQLYQPIVIGVVLAILAHTMELFILKRETFWTSTILDFIAATAIVYFVSNLFAGAVVTFFGAILTAILLMITELVQHFWLITSGRTKKHA